MFSLAFLEIKSRTKISNSKTSIDKKIGLAVILTVFLYYILVYLPLLISNTASGDGLKANFIIQVYNQFL